MAYNEATKKSTLAYREKHIKRIVLDVKTEYYDSVKSAADSCNESLAGYVKKAINTRMETEGFKQDQPETSEN